MSQEARTGRPKSKGQTRPIIFERVRSKIRRELSMSAKTSHELDRYVMWAAAEVGADEEEAQCLTLDLALGQFLARDKLFQDSLEDKTKSLGNQPKNAEVTTEPARALPGVGVGTGGSPLAGQRATGVSAPPTRPAVQP